MRQALAFAILALLCSGPSLAQQKTLLLIPFEMKGTYQPVGQAELTEILKAQIERVAPDMQVKLGSPAAMLDPEQAARMGVQAGTDLVLFGDVRFRTEATAVSLTGGPPEGSPGQPIPAGFAMRYMVTVAGVAHGSLVESASGKLLVDEEPQLLMESEMTGGAKDGPVMKEVEQRLAGKCAHDLGKGLIEHVQARARSGK
jgi:hypothetical protein